VGFSYTKVPKAVVDAAERLIFPVFEVPYPVPFIAITEAVFTWPGMGRLIFTAVAQKDFPLLPSAVLVVGIWLVFFYRWLGVVTLGALTVFGVMVWSIISALGYLGFALTLAGVAGLIVAIGITADSSIIYFERIRDEVNLGKTVRTATSRAFKSAFRTNLAGNTVTLAAALILYFLATGPVRGFALMLGMATVLDLLILYLFTRPVVGLMANTKLMNRRNVRAAQPEPTKTAKAGAT
jgi:preprotein translocase subunit SecF